ncbi:unnamed protein product [Trichobilharzia regenti]|nr:unnamed protein product [Trichobilharzia regenti]
MSTLPYCTIELGRLPNTNPLSIVKNHNHTLKKKNTTTITSGADENRSSLPSSLSQQLHQSEEYDICPPYPPPSEELPALFGGIMPFIEPPAFIRDMDTVPEQQDDEEEENKDKRSRTNQLGFEKFTETLNNNNNISIEHENQLKDTNNRITTTAYQKEQIDKSIDNNSISAFLTKDEIDKALELTERFNGGFYVRQICLPIAPVLTNDDNATTQNRLGLRLIDGPGVSGPVVVRIEPNSCASRTDIQIGDRILGLDDKLLLSLGHGNNCSADNILSTIENVWITRSVNNSSVGGSNYDQNPCCLTIISNRSLTPPTPLPSPPTPPPALSTVTTFYSLGSNSSGYTKEDNTEPLVEKNRIMMLKMTSPLKQANQDEDAGGNAQLVNGSQQIDTPISSTTTTTDKNKNMINSTNHVNRNNNNNMASSSSPSCDSSSMLSGEFQHFIFCV